MYKSPIELITSTIATEMRKNQEQQVMRAVQSVGVNVDKDELLKALQYDRQQYEKGYADAIKAFAEIVKESKRSLFNYIYSEKGFDEQIDIIASGMRGVAE